MVSGRIDSKPTNSIAIFFINSSRLIIEGLLSIFKDIKRFKIAGYAFDAKEALIKINEEVDLVIIGIDPTAMNGSDLVSTIKKLYPNIKMIAMGRTGKKHKIMQMLKAGCLGYIAEDSIDYDFNKALNTISHGKPFLCEKTVRIINDNDDRYELLNQLTQREKKIFELVAMGKKNIEIADQLGVSIRTIEGNRRSLMDKLHISNVSELTRMAIRYNVVDL